MKKQIGKGTIPEGSQYTTVVLKGIENYQHSNEIITITGNGMEPLYCDGDRLFVAYCDEIRVGEVGVFEFPDTGIVIRYKAEDGLRRINPACDTSPISEEGSMVIGRVLGKITPDMIPTPEEEKLYREACALKNKGLIE